MNRIGAALLISAAFVSQAAFAAFTSGMSASALQAEVRAQSTQGKSALEIARAALAAGVAADSLTSAMLQANIASGTAIEAILRAGGDAALVQSAALANRVSQSVITAAADRAGVTLPSSGPLAGGGGSGSGFGPTGNTGGPPGAGGGGPGSRR
jgi:hypothetical protein